MLPPLKEPQRQLQEPQSERRLHAEEVPVAPQGAFPEDLHSDTYDTEVELDDLIAKREAWKQTGWATFVLAYSSLGVIYGDIGTSPLYTYAGIFTTIEPTQQDILGAMSLIFWSITIIVLGKYVLIVLKANDQGEGGTFALYTRLCRIIGIGGMKPMNHHEREVVAQVAAATEELSKASRNSLARATRDLPRAMSRMSRMSRVSRPKLSKLSDGDASKELAINTAGSPPTVPSHRSLIHFAAFPGEPIRSFFRHSIIARGALLAVSVLATSMVVGDGVLTPAISVVSAVQGLTLKTNITNQGVVGISCGILVALFLIQSIGTQRVSFLFSPVIVLWMLSLLAVGIYNVSRFGGQIFKGLSPSHIVIYFNDHGTQAWESLGGVMLCITGVEALFADLGHFSVGAVRFGFSFFVYPCIVFAYLGQGAYLMDNLGDVSSAFYASVPDAFFWPQLIIATLAAVVASQALISGAFSIIRQAITLDLFPPLKVVHTGKHVEGQIYIGTVNYTLMVLSVAVVAGFNGDGTKIGNAYGIAVSMVMIITTGLMLVVMLVDWELSVFLIVPFGSLFLLLEGGYLSANLVKVPQGGWFALLMAGIVALLQFVWMTGRTAKTKALQESKHTTSADIADILTVVPNETSSNGPSDDAKPLVTKSTPAVRSGRFNTDLAARSVGFPSLATRSRPLGSDLQPAVSSTSVEINQRSGTPRLTVVTEEFGEISRGSVQKQRSRQDTESTKDVRPGRTQLSFFDVGVARLRGIGIFYTQSQQGMPAVMWHFLRNVEAVHEVVVLLENQFLPIPYLNFMPGVKELQRFTGLRPVEGMPHFYRVTARYGYMDVVDNGLEFVNSIKECIEANITDAANGSGPLAAALPTQAAALEELKLLDAAYAQGVVYYLGRSRLRMKNLRNTFVQVMHDVWYGELYRTLAINCWDKIESWRIPPKSMVEIGVVVEI